MRVAFGEEWRTCYAESLADNVNPLIDMSASGDIAPPRPADAADTDVLTSRFLDSIYH